MSPGGLPTLARLWAAAAQIRGLDGKGPTSDAPAPRPPPTLAS